MRSSRLSRLFVGLTLVVLVSDVAFVAANYVAARHALSASLTAEGDKLRSGFGVALGMTNTNMLQLATFIAGDTRIQDVALAGKRAVEEEGGGPGGERAAVARRILLELVEDRWRTMTEQFGVRQLHFHFAPGSLSFLRVHAVEKFGDRMDGVRHIIVDVNRDGRPRIGLETGRIYTGLRGVVPLAATDPFTGGRVNVGAVEVGSSFEPVLETVAGRLGAGIAVLLKKEHVAETMWEDFIARHLPGRAEACQCYVEATSSGEIYRLVAERDFQTGYDGSPVTHPVRVDDRMLAVTRFPLRDYLGDNDPHRPPVGSVVIWTDATAAFREFEQGLWFNIIYGVFGFILVESVLWAAMRFGEGRLRSELTRATEAHRAAAERNRAILDAAAEGIYGIDRSGLTSFANRAALAMLGWQPGEIVGHPHHALIHHTAADGSPYPEQRCPVLGTLTDGEVRSVAGEVFWRKDGSSFPVDYVVGPLRAADGRIEGAVVVFRDDTERLRARREIEEKATALEASNHELAQFASVISHDLQAPLRMVVSYLGLIQQKLSDALDDEGREYLDFAIGGGKRMSAMIRDLLAYSRVGRDQSEATPVDLREVVETVLGDLSIPIEDAGAVIEVDPMLPTVTGRAGDLMRLIENLVTNALKYRHPGRPPRVRISASRHESGWRVDVADNGLGIPADQRERVFGFFQRVGRGPDEEGSGIGLAVARKIVGQHGGRIWVEDGPDGAGSRFSFTLPAG